MKYEERLRKLNGLSEFINGEKQDDILLVLDKKYSDDKWNIICSAVHWFRTVESYLNSENLLKENKEDYNWGEVYLFLSSVDIVIEGINDINKIAKDNEKARLFYKSSEIFKDKPKNFKTGLQRAVYNTLERIGIQYERVDTDEAITMDDCVSINKKLNVKMVNLYNHHTTNLHPDSFWGDYIYFIPNIKYAFDNIVL